MSKFRYPVDYIAITTYFIKGEHNGIDLGWNSKHGGKNQPIYAAGDGKVVSLNSIKRLELAEAVPLTIIIPSLYEVIVTSLEV